MFNSKLGPGGRLKINYWKIICYCSGFFEEATAAVLQPITYLYVLKPRVNRKDILWSPLYDKTRKQTNNPPSTLYMPNKQKWGEDTFFIRMR